MRGLPVASLLLLAFLSGCVSFVEDDPEAQAAADELGQALDEYNAEAGHIAGTVLGGTAATPLAGALVDLLGGTQDVQSDAEGRFAFLDLAPGIHTLAVEAAGHLPQQVTVEVTAGQFTRPTVALAEDAPEPTMQVYRFDGFQDVANLQCWCDFDQAFDRDGLTEVLVEADLEASQPLMPAHRFLWTFSAWDADGNATDHGGMDDAPLRSRIDAADMVEEPTAFRLYMEPDNGLVPLGPQAFTAYVTAFYDGPMPPEYTAFAQHSPDA